MQTLQLVRPLTLADGTTVDELSLDFESLSVADLRQVSRLEGQVTDVETGGGVLEAVRGKAWSFSFQVATGFVAAMKVTPGLRLEDYTRLGLKDALGLAEAANFFWALSGLAAEAAP